MSDTYTDSTTQPTVWRLANDAGVSGPDSATSPGAEWLALVYLSALEIVDDLTDKDWSVSAMLEDGDTFDMITDTADHVVPIYTHNLWQVFVDLTAYTEDVDEYEPEDMTQSASVALYLIARRLIETTLDGIAEDEENTA